MIARYTRPEMASVWLPQNTYQIWFEVEAHAATKLADLRIIPKSAARTIWRKGARKKYNIESIQEIEREVRHDVIAFLTYIAKLVGPDARYLHQGLTSSDVLDTALNVQLVQASDILLEDIDKLLQALKKLALKHKYTICVGRSHGIHAEPTTFGLKLASHYAALSRARDRLVSARNEVSTCAISGAVGTFANIDPRVEAYVAKKMGLRPEPVSTQVIPRDRHAMYFATLGVVAASLENLATEIRHLQRTEVREVEEPFAKGQKGSSAMPHKRNPVLCENVCGLARLVRGYVQPALENVALWHERDISHSSVERVIAPDATIALDFALNRMTEVIGGLQVYPKRMKQNLELAGGLVYSQRVLLALTQAGMSREKAYRVVQKSSMEVWDRGGSLFKNLLNDPEVAAAIPVSRLAKLFDASYHTRRVDTIFKRVFKK